MSNPTIAARRSFLKAGAGLLLVGLAGCTTSGVLSPAGGTGSDQTAESLVYVNKLRAERGLPALSHDPMAAQAAMEQASRMASAGRMQHNIGLGPSFYDRMKSRNVTLPAAENIAAGQGTANEAYLAWFRSPRHLENMLGAGYRGLGVAVVRNPASANRPYWAMVLSS